MELPTITRTEDRAMSEHLGSLSRGVEVMLQAPSSLLERSFGRRVSVSSTSPATLMNTQSSRYRQQAYEIGVSLFRQNENGDQPAYLEETNWVTGYTSCSPAHLPSSWCLAQSTTYTPRSRHLCRHPLSLTRQNKVFVPYVCIVSKQTLSAPIHRTTLQIHRIAKRRQDGRTALVFDARIHT